MAKVGLKLQPVEAEHDDTRPKGSRIPTLSAKGPAIATLAELVSRYLHTLLIDRTGTGGVYNFELRWAADDHNADDTLTLPVALQETPGLRYRRRRLRSK